jgi:DedD protein
MADRIAVENADQIVDEMKRKARRRLVGAIVLALAAAIILPMLLEKEPRPLGDDVSVKIPPVDESKFVNRLTGKSGEAKALPKATEKSDTKAPAKPEARSDSATPSNASSAAPATESAAAKKSVADAEQRVLAPVATAATTDAGAGLDRATEARREAGSADTPTETKVASIDQNPLSPRQRQHRVLPQELHR